MANVYQQAAKRRKIGYLAAMGALLVLSLVVRGTFFRIGSASADEVAADPVKSLTMDGRAKVHELTELQQGDKELGGAAVQLLLTGSRGLAVCGLWLGAIEKQREQEWSELDIAVDSITKLQPHFTAPWLFQSWNLAYNVSVEMDRLNDMYFYIARGISVAAEGESVNRNNPDLRYNVGFYYQNKFGVSDRVTTLRCLYQLSCIPDEDRDPDRLLNPDRTINPERFEQFCREHRMLVRRLKEARIPLEGSEEKGTVLARTPTDVIAFLRNNRKLPSRYKPGTKDVDKDHRLKQFPVLPELQGQPITTRELDYRAELGDAEQDAFLASRGWYSLANCALPPPDPLPIHDGTYNPDPLRYRIPKRPATIIFRQGPPRAQTYFAERLTKEGWFTGQDAWVVDRLDESRAWLPRNGPDGRRVAVAIEPWPGGTAQEAWKEAYDRWFAHGRDNGLRMAAARMLTFVSQAEEYCRRHPGLRVGDLTPPLSPDEADDPHIQELHRAHQVVHGWSASRSMTNFESFELESEAMQTDDAMLAKLRFRQADKAVREAAQFSEAVRLYDEGFAAWLRVLAAHQGCRAQQSNTPGSNITACRDFRDLDRPQEEVYELNVRYVKLVQDIRQGQLRSATVWLNDFAFNLGATTTGNPFQFAGSLGVLAADVERPTGPGARVPELKNVPALPLPGLLDGNAPDGTPWISDDVKRRIKERAGLIKPQAAPPAAAIPPGGPRPDSAPRK